MTDCAHKSSDLVKCSTELLAARKEVMKLRTEIAELRGQVPSARADNLFYLQNGYLGNAMCFWRQGRAGYTTDLNKAHRFTESQAFHQHGMRDEDVPWPCAYLDGKSGRSVDVQHVSREEAFPQSLHAEVVKDGTS